MLKIGHRGAKGYVAENTLASFEKAIELEVDAIELDIHLSIDNQLMVIHDETIDRTTTKCGFVNEYTASELQQLGIPTLEEVFDLVNQKCLINIEIKDENATEKVINLIKKYVSEKNWNYREFQISSFIWEVLSMVSKRNPNIALGVLTEDDIYSALAFAKKTNAYSINPFFKLLNSENVALIRENGFKIYAWTVNTEEDLIFVKSLNIDGIISDFPDRI